MINIILDQNDFRFRFGIQNPKPKIHDLKFLTLVGSSLNK